MNNTFDVFILKQTDYKEHDVIIQALSKEYGIISLIVKGMKKQTSKLAYAFQLFSLTRVTIDFVNKDKLHTVKNAVVLNSYRLLREDLDCLTIQSVCAELTLKFAQMHQLYAMYQEFVDMLISKENMLTVMNIFLAKLLALEGNAPMVDGCVMCGTQRDIVSISLEEGGFVCKYCNTNLHLPLSDVSLLQAYRVIHKVDFHQYDVIANYEVNDFRLSSLLLDALSVHSGISTVSRRFLQEYYSKR